MSYILFLPFNKKPNGKLFNLQKGNLCTAYSFLRVLHFHNRHPKYYKGEYPNNFLLGIKAFKEVRDKTERFLKDLQTRLYFDELVKNNIIDKNPLNKAEDNSDSSDDEENDLLDQIDLHIRKEHWMQADFINKSKEDEFDFYNYNVGQQYAYLFGFQLLPIKDIKNLSEIKLLLLKYGPLVTFGKFGLTSKDIFEVGTVESDTNQFKLNSIKTENYNEGHAMTIIGVDLINNNIFYLDSNFSNIILQVNFNVFLTHLFKPFNVFYLPCKNAVYLENKVKTEDYKDEDFNRCDVDNHITCEHVQQNLNIKKSINLATILKEKSNAKEAMIGKKKLQKYEESISHTQIPSIAFFPENESIQSKRIENTTLSELSNNDNYDAEFSQPNKRQRI